MSKKFKFLGLPVTLMYKCVGLGLAVLLLTMVVGAGSAGATLTLSSVAVDSAAGDAMTIGASNVGGTIAIGVANTGGITIGNGATVKTISIGAGNAVNTIKIGDNATPVNVITIGGAASSLALTDAQWSITSPGVATFVNGLVSASATLGLDVGAAGNLQLGGVTATSVGIGSAAVTAVTVTTDGTGDAEVELPDGSINTDELLDNTVGVADLAASLAFANADLVSFASVSVTDATEGLILPQHATDCSTAGTAEGQVCWEADANVLYIGDGATVAAITPNTASNNTWTGTNAFNGTSVTLGDAVTDGLTVASAIQGASPLIFDGLTDDTNELTLAVADVGADVTITLPSATGTLATLAGTETLSGKTLTTPVIGVATGTSLAVSGLLTTSSPTAAFGFATSAGGAVTQITNSATAVTLDKNTGQITTVALTTAAAAEEAFVVNNSNVSATDIIAVSTTYAGAGKPNVFVTNVGAGVFTINITNVHAADALNAVLIINFAVIQGVAS